MSKAHIDPAELRRFAQDLNRFNNELQTLLSSTDSESVEFADDEHTLFFRVGHRTLSTRKLSGQFPNYEAVMPRDNTKFAVVRSSELSENASAKRSFVAITRLPPVSESSVALLTRSNHTDAARRGASSQRRLVMAEPRLSIDGAAAVDDQVF